MVYSASLRLILLYCAALFVCLFVCLLTLISYLHEQQCNRRRKEHRNMKRILTPTGEYCLVYPGYTDWYLADNFN